MSLEEELSGFYEIRREICDDCCTDSWLCACDEDECRGMGIHGWITMIRVLPFPAFAYEEEALEEDLYHCNGMGHACKIPAVYRLRIYGREEIERYCQECIKKELVGFIKVK